MADRKAELERKKQKLEQMRKERQEKERIRKLKESTNDDVKKGGGQDLRTETDELLKDLGIPPVGDTPSTTPAVFQENTPAPKGSPQPAPVLQISSRQKAKLSVVKVGETNIPPRENVTYSKETQTIIQEPVDKEARGPWDYYDDLSDASQHSALIWGGSRFSSPRHSHGSPHHSNSSRYGSPKFMHDDMSWEDEFSLYSEDDETMDDSEMGQSPAQHKMPHVEMVKPTTTQEDVDKMEEKPPVPELSEEEKLQILNSEEFQTFFARSSRIIERALCESVDIFTDYSGAEGEGNLDDALAGERLKLQRDFYDERWSRHRTVTSLDWSKQFPELLVASYNASEDSPHDPDGVALIWNSKYKTTTPEYIFHCQSAIMSSCFAEFHPNLVVGGTYSGQIVLWDNRVNKRTPVQRTPLSAAAHTHPVYCINVVGTQNAHNLISVSTDGKMCSWSLDMLSQPQDNMDLQHKGNKAVAVTCFSFLSGDVNNFVVGSEDCAVYTACRHGSKAGISESFEGHLGPITGVHSHSVPGQIDFSPYFLTSSFDWTIKLWSIKEQKFLHSFEDNSDYIYDVQWSPIHPALFASVDGNGRLDLWNLNMDTEVPFASVTMENNTALNHCRWHSSGSNIAVGDDVGRVHIYDVAESTANPKSDEWSRFVHTLQEIKQHAAEREEESSFNTLTAPLR